MDLASSHASGQGVELEWLAGIDSDQESGTYHTHPVWRVAKHGFRTSKLRHGHRQTQKESNRVPCHTDVWTDTCVLR